ncbi:MAG: dihydrofolate reductase family protein [Dehalococcoidia bacterium]|nr:dihydrofolate reductase family protein [Dehalococcoidia bacterium]
MSDITPLEPLYDEPHDDAVAVPLPTEMARLYGQLQFRAHPGRPYVISNFVSTLDGVTALGGPDQSGGGAISGFNAHDRMVMGLLRAVADAVVIGAGTLRADPAHVWTSEFIYAPLTAEYRALRAALGKPRPPLTVVVTGRGTIDTALPVFQLGQAPALVVTTPEGAGELRKRGLPQSCAVAVAGDDGPIAARGVVDAIVRHQRNDIILVEGGPRLLGAFFEERLLDELFLTVAPQVAGRDGGVERPGLVAGRLFAPERPVWGRLLSVKRGDSHLFLRYGFGEE